jgi:hypothetical protein
VNLPRQSDRDNDRPDDGELLRELRAALREPPVPEEILRAARGAFAWRTVDADLELLSLVTEGLPDDASPEEALVRGGGSAAPRVMVFHGERVRVEIEIDDVGVIGQVVPAQSGQVTMISAGGARSATQTDEVGCFSFPPPDPGPFRLMCAFGTDRFATEWVTR